MTDFESIEHAIARSDLIHVIESTIFAVGDDPADFGPDFNLEKENV